MSCNDCIHSNICKNEQYFDWSYACPDFMEIIYRAEERDAYEKLSEIEMYDENGNRTTEAGLAVIVHLLSPDQTRVFKDRHHCKIGPYGINDNDTGWFYWDKYSYSFHWINYDMIKAFQNITL